MAGTVAAPINRLGMAGVAPGVELVNIRAGQDSGYFFLQPSVDALTYAADIGVDVVNMSYYIDPWLYNCADNPADSPEEQLEQRTVIQATERALAYARARGVTLVSAEGNGNTRPRQAGRGRDQPGLPAGQRARRATIDNSCKSEPLEAPGVLGITSVGPEQAQGVLLGLRRRAGRPVGARRRHRREFFGTPDYNNPANTVLAPYPKSLAIANGELNPDGTPNTPFVLADCSRGRLRVLPVPAGHLDGVAARGRRGGPGGGVARAGTTGRTAG